MKHEVEALQKKCFKSCFNAAAQNPDQGVNLLEPKLLA